ncbi:MAG: hypothetical protein JWQ10_351 [Herbaspirillum sp.]|nr:hypothetical protein [Herbaspirillum sp.]
MSNKIQAKSSNIDNFSMQQDTAAVKPGSKNRGFFLQNMLNAFSKNSNSFFSSRTKDKAEAGVQHPFRLIVDGGTGVDKPDSTARTENEPTAEARPLSKARLMMPSRGMLNGKQVSIRKSLCDIQAGIEKVAVGYCQPKDRALFISSIAEVIDDLKGTLDFMESRFRLFAAEDATGAPEENVEHIDTSASSRNASGNGEVQGAIIFDRSATLQDVRKIRSQMLQANAALERTEKKDFGFFDSLFTNLIERLGKIDASLKVAGQANYGTNDWMADGEAIRQKLRF